MLASERRYYILEELNKKRVVSLKEIAKELDVAEVTIRRDFEKLEKAGKLVRISGGVTKEDYLNDVELSLQQKEALNLEGKIKVAKKAAKLVSPGDTVFLDGGTSMVPLAKELAPLDIQIVTFNALAIPEFRNAKASVFILGGRLYQQHMINIGPEAMALIKKYRFDVGFFGCSGIELEKELAYTSLIDSTLLKEAAMENSKVKYLLADSTKLGGTSFIEFQPFDAFDRILCDRPKDFKIQDKRFDFVD